MTIGENIRYYRDEADLTQEALAHKAGVAHMTVSRLERNIQRPGVDLLQKIARALGVTLDDLAGEL